MTLAAVFKVTILLAASLGAAAILRRAAAATRSAIFAGAQLGALLLPLLSSVVPRVPVRWIAPPPESRLDLSLPNEQRLVTRLPTKEASARSIDWLALVWLAGASAVAAAAIRRYARAVVLVRRARRTGALLLSAEVDQPVTFGRSILLPQRASSWTEERRRTVMLHEEGHVARRDTLLMLLSDAVCTVYWFHPLAWLVAWHARLERERACDDHVLSAGVAPADYAMVLLDIARDASLPRAAVSSMAERSELERRLRAIVDPSVSHVAPRSGRLALAVCLVVAIPILAALAPAARVPRPFAIEPDLLGDEITSPFSERLEPVPLVNVPAAGPDASLIALMSRVAERPPRTGIDFTGERARWALTRVRRGELVAPLIGALRDPDWRVRTYAAWALAYSGDLRASPAIVPLLGEPIWRVRAMAAHALAELGNPSDASLMLAHIDDPAWQVRVEVVRYLGKQRTSRPEIEAMLTDRHAAVRAVAVRVLEER